MTATGIVASSQRKHHFAYLSLFSNKSSSPLVVILALNLSEPVPGTRHRWGDPFVILDIRIESNRLGTDWQHHCAQVDSIFAQLPGRERSGRSSGRPTFAAANHTKAPENNSRIQVKGSQG
jgi:hypothetical protein